MIVTAKGPGLSCFSVALCEVGAGQSVHPGAWVNVSIVAQTGNVPDSEGHMLHCKFRFSPSPSGEVGKRRQWQKDCLSSAINGTDPRAPIEVETDGGCYWIGTTADVFFVGGNPGDQYEISITYNCPREERDPEAEIDQWEPPFTFWLTTWAAGAGPIVVPDLHTKARIVQGALASATLPLGDLIVPYSWGIEIPTSAPLVTRGPSIFQTGGEL